MIFISYNHNDQQLVDMVARQLEVSFGRNNIFYDKWSMQPGDSILEKMNEGLEQFTTFFYFLSNNSLKSNMVTREWQSALMSALSNNLKFVPIRLDDCNPPAIMKDLLYINLYGSGIDEAISQMRAVASRENNYEPLEDKENLVATLHKKTDFEIEFEICATMFSVQSVNFAFVCDNDFDDFDVLIHDEPIMYTQKGEAFKDLSNGEQKNINMVVKTIYRVLTPNRSLKGVLKSKKSPLNFEGILHYLSENNFKVIKLIWT